jgi:Ca2+-binding RTX toxin-like protein
LATAPSVGLYNPYGNVAAIFMRGGDDILMGGLGHDRLYGGTGNDELQGNEGDDKLITLNFIIATTTPEFIITFFT